MTGWIFLVLVGGAALGLLLAVASRLALRARFGAAYARALPWRHTWATLSVLLGGGALAVALAGPPSLLPVMGTVGLAFAGTSYLNVRLAHKSRGASPGTAEGGA